jgi:anti-sigma factor (TIGR02949 family)
MTRRERYSCEDTFRRLDDYVDRNLTEAEREHVEQHLRECEACAREYDFEHSLVQEIRGKLQRIKAPADLLNMISARLTKAG